MKSISITWRVMLLLTLVAVLFSGSSSWVPSAQAAPADRYVDDDDVFCGGNSPCYSTIGAALAAVVADGETIEVAAGTYTENLVVNRPVNLIGAGAAVTTLKSANGSSEFLILLGANVPITFSQGMVLEGFTLKGPLDGDEDLLMFRARVADPLDPIIVRENVFDCADADKALKGIETRSGGDATNAVIEDNSFINLCRYAMFLNSAINWSIQRNSFDNYRYGGVVMNTSDLDQLHDIDILDNTFQDGSSDGLSFLPNQFVAAVGLSSVMYNVEVVGNTIQNSVGGHSITIGDRGNPVLTGMNIECNDIVNNVGGALNELPAFVIPAENNWWGAADGPSGVGLGSGDAVTAGYDFDPFLTSPVSEPCPPPPNEPPDCSAAQPSVDPIWPPNHKFVPIDVLGVTDPDGDSISITIDSIFQDEKVDTFGDGSFTPDGQGVGSSTAEVRAERAGTKKVPGNGRVYHIGFTADDGNGGTCDGEVLVGVPHDQGKGKVPIDDGALYDSTALAP